MKYLRKLLPRKWSRLTKKILGFLVVFSLSGIFLQGNVGTPEIHAESAQTNVTTPSAGIDKMDFVQLFDLILKVIYILLWPLLVIAGRALDNTLVYGAFFHMDAPLWKFRNMIKNFANFALVGVVLYSIISSVIGKGGAKPVDIIKKTLIAGVLIQASWFLMAAVIDVSTVATYAVGGLPLSVLQNTTLGDTKILSVHTELDMNKFSNITQEGYKFKITYGAGQYLLSTCNLSDNADTAGSARYIVGRSELTGTEMGLCVLFGTTVIKFDETGLKTAYLAKGFDETNYLLFSQGKTSSPLDDATIEDRLKKGYIVDILSGASGFDKSVEQGMSRFTGTNAMTTAELITRSKGFVGPLVTIYSSILNFAQISDASTGSFGKVSGEVIIKVAIAIALLFPLIALALILIVRIGYLWLFIATSPFLVLKECFKETLKLPEKMEKVFSVGNVVGVAFAPVITVFALSISLIFMTTLINSFSNQKAGQSQDILGPEVISAKPSKAGSSKYIIGGTTDIEFTNFTRSGTLDRFSWLMVNLIAVGLVWALLYVALTAGSLGKSIGKPVMDFGGNFMKTLPILPVPGGRGDRVGAGSMFKVAKETPDRWLNNRTTEQETAAREFIDSKFDGKSKNTAVTPEVAGIFKPGGDVSEKLHEKINEGRESDEEMSASAYVYANHGALLTEFNKWSSTGDKEKGVDAAATLWGLEFEKESNGKEEKVEAIESLLNTNEITKRYAEQQTANGKAREVKTKDGKAHKVTYDKAKETTTPVAIAKT